MSDDRTMEEASTGNLLKCLHLFCGKEEKKSSRNEGVQERIENSGLNMVKMHSIIHVMRPV